MDLDGNIPEKVKSDWFVGKILQKLQRYGVVSNKINILILSEF